MEQNKTPTDATLLRWRRAILNGSASDKVCMNLLNHVENTYSRTGFKPVALMDAYYKVKYTREGDIREYPTNQKDSFRKSNEARS